MRIVFLLAVLVGCAPRRRFRRQTPADATQCLVGTSQGCATGQYCTVGNDCVAGCATDADCGSGSSCCDHACVDESSDALNCGSCGNVCSGACCTGSCSGLNTLTDCGTCGNSCSTGDFCDGTQCNAPVYPNFCANKNVYVIYDGITNDNNAADLMASTITTNCPPDVIVHTGNQTDATLVDQTTGAPLGGGGVTYVLGGGPFPSKPLKWLETTQVTRIYFDAPDGVNYYWRERPTATQVAMMPAANCSAHADQFISELVTDPMSGTLSLIGYGACSGSRGTDAAAYYYANVMLPNRADYPDSWYVFGWADTNMDSIPNAGDTFTVLAHGL